MDSAEGEVRQSTEGGGRKNRVEFSFETRAFSTRRRRLVRTDPLDTVRRCVNAKNRDVGEDGIQTEITTVGLEELPCERGSGDTLKG